MSTAISRSFAAVLLVTCVLALLLEVRPLDDVDLYGQIRLGLIALGQGGLLKAEPFTYTHAGESFPVAGWLGQLLYAAAYRLGGWGGVQLLHVLVFAAGLGAAAVWARQVAMRRGRELTVFSLVGAVVAGFLVAASSSSARPQSFVVGLFPAALVVLHSRWSAPRKLALLGLLFVIWQNVHASLMVMTVVLAAIALESLWGWWTEKTGCVLPLPLVLWAAVLSLAAQLATPLGFKVFAFSSTNLRIARDLLGMSEWLPAWDSSVLPAMWPFWAVLAATIAALAAVRLRVSISSLGFLAIFTGLTLYSARFVLFWALVLIPLWAQLLEELRPRTLFNWCISEPVQSRWSLRLALLVGLAALAAPFVNSSRLLDSETPWKLLEQLKAQMPVARIYSYREWSGPVSFVGYPGWKVAIDWRLYLFGPQEWQEYESAAAGTVPLSEIVARHRPDLFLLHRGFHSALIRQLRESPAWKELPGEGEAVAFLPAVLSTNNRRPSLAVFNPLGSTRYRSLTTGSRNQVPGPRSAALGEIADPHL